MMSMKDIGKMFDLLESNYGKTFYDGVDKDNVLKLWSVMFKDDDPESVMQGVMNCINTLYRKPTIADVRIRMAQARMGGQMTAMEAFQAISNAVRKTYGKESAITEFNALPPIVRKVVGFPEMLIDWSKVSTEAFQTVVMSAIRESYREFAQREADYYALPKQMQTAESWRVEAPAQESLPEPKPQKSHEERFAEMDEDAKAYRERFGMTQKDMTDRVAEFQNMTDSERKMYEAKEKHKLEVKLEKMRLRLKNER